MIQSKRSSSPKAVRSGLSPSPADSGSSTLTVKVRMAAVTEET